MLHFMIVLIPYIILLNSSWIRKMSIFRKYGAFETGRRALKSFIS